jgi:hypothetical protein
VGHQVSRPSKKELYPTEPSYCITQALCGVGKEDWEMAKESATTSAKPVIMHTNFRKS